MVRQSVDRSVSQSVTAHWLQRCFRIAPYFCPRSDELSRALGAGGGQMFSHLGESMSVCIFKTQK